MLQTLTGLMKTMSKFKIKRMLMSIQVKTLSVFKKKELKDKYFHKTPCKNSKTFHTNLCENTMFFCRNSVIEIVVFINEKAM